MIGDTRKLPGGMVEEVVSETPITGYVTETPEQERERERKGLPCPTYGFVAVKVEVKPGSEEKKSLQSEAADIMKKPYKVRQDHYREVSAKRGDKAKAALVAEVNRQFRIAERKQGMEI